MCTSRLHKVVACRGGDFAEVEDLDGALHQVSLLALDGPRPSIGEWLVVHSGYAFDRVGPNEAEAVAQEIRRGRVGASEHEGAVHS